MVATNTIKINGVWYQAGDELPSDRTPKVEPKEDVKPEVKEEKEYSKTEIMRMNNQALRKLASKNGIDNPEEYTGAELKDMLVEKLGL